VIPHAQVLEDQSILQQKIEAGQRMAFYRGVHEPAWQASIRQIRAEMAAQRAVQAEALSEQVGAIWREIEALRTAQNQTCLVQVTALRKEVLFSIQGEREARQGECAEIRSTLEKLQGRLMECHHLMANREDSIMRRQTSLTGAEFENIMNELNEEKLRRCSQVSDIHARIGREVADLNWHVQNQKFEITDELEAKTRLTEERHSALEKVVDREREHSSRESNELRAILDSVWQRATNSGSAGQPLKEGKSYYLRYEDENGDIERTKELVGDQEDINTLYEMVREALGDTVYLREQLTQDREARSRELVATRQQAARLEKQLNTTQALMREAAVCPECRSQPLNPTDEIPTTSPPSLSSLPPVDSGMLQQQQQQQQQQQNGHGSAEVLEDLRSEVLAKMDAQSAEVHRTVETRLRAHEASLLQEVGRSVERVLQQERRQQEGAIASSQAARQHL